MLLLTAMFQQVGIINLYLPTLEEALLQEEQEDPGNDFTLAVAVTTTEISLMRDEEVLLTEKIEDGVEFAKLTEKLTQKLSELKKEVPDKKDVVLLLDSQIRYEMIIEIMDAVRVKGDEELFPDISLADRIVEEG
jgi:biopolymer transport protein ExbD